MEQDDQERGLHKLGWKQLIVVELIEEMALINWNEGFMLSAQKVWDKGFVGVWWYLSEILAETDNGATQPRERFKQTWIEVTTKVMIVVELIEEMALNKADWKKRFMLPAQNVWDKSFVGGGGGDTNLKLWQNLEVVYFNLAFNKCNV